MTLTICTIIQVTHCYDYRIEDISRRLHYFSQKFLFSVLPRAKLSLFIHSLQNINIICLILTTGH